MREYLKEVRESAGAAAALAGLFGAVVYALLTFVCSLIYTPLGVSPGEVGLSYGALLIRTAVGVGGTAILGMAAAAAALVLARSVWKVGLDPSSDSRIPGGLGKGRLALLLGVLAIAGPVSLCVVLWHPVLGLMWLGLFLFALLAIAVASAGVFSPKVVALLLVGFVLAVGAAIPVGLVAGSATGDAVDLREGRAPRPVLGIPPPWAAQVVRVTWADKPGPALSVPRCLLYLGEANGTSVFYDARPNSERALRLPTSRLLVEVLPKTRSSLPPKRGASRCS